MRLRPYDIRGVVRGSGRPAGLPMRSLKYSGGSSLGRAGRGINSTMKRY